MSDKTAHILSNTLIIVAVCTYERQEELRRTLTALQNQLLRGISDERVRIVVIDNSPTASARTVVQDFEGASRFQVLYAHECRKGVAHARNRAIEIAVSEGATHLAFVDDDEVPEQDWLNELFEKIVETEAAAAVGPVFPIFCTCPEPHLPINAFATLVSDTDGLVADGYSGNSIIDVSYVQQHNLRFDNQFNEVGGEDTIFFRQLRSLGGRIAWAGEAIVHEFVPPERMKIIWLLRRWYRTGSIEGELGPYPSKSWPGRVHNLGRGALRLAVGAPMVIFNGMFAGWRRPSSTVASCYTFCRGAGLIASVLGTPYKEYSKTNYR